MKTEGNIVTVVTCTYNRSKLIGSLYDSLLKQTAVIIEKMAAVCLIQMKLYYDSFTNLLRSARHKGHWKPSGNSSFSAI